MDIFADPKIPLKAEEAFKTLNIFKKGRPLWNGVLQGGSSEIERVTEAVELALTKISNGTRKVEESSIVLSIACLNLRVALEVRSSGHLAESLPAKHMRYITAISSSRDMVMSEYPSDPILSHAAAIHMAQTTPTRPSIILNHLIAGLEHNLVSPGEIGEVMTQFVLILARDQCVFGRRTGCIGLSASLMYPLTYPSVTLREFLLQINTAAISTLESEFQANSIDPRAHMLQSLLSASVNFSHFVKISYTPTLEDLRLAYLRGCAFACADNQVGIDLIIPLKLERKPTQLSHSYMTRRRSLLVTKGEKSPQGGVFPNNDALLKADIAQFVTAKNGQCERKRVINDDAELIKKTAKHLRRRQYPKEPPGTEFPLNEISFGKIQTKNTPSSNNKADLKMHPGNCGIMDPNTIDRPFFALRNNLRGKNPIKRMATDTEKPFRFGLVVGEFKTATAPCLNYHKLDNDEDLGDLITKVIDARLKPVAQLPETLDRITLAGGGEINKVKFTEKALTAQNTSQGSEPKKHRK